MEESEVITLKELHAHLKLLRFVWMHGNEDERKKAETEAKSIKETIKIYEQISAS